MIEVSVQAPPTTSASGFLHEWLREDAFVYPVSVQQNSRSTYIRVITFVCTRCKVRAYPHVFDNITSFMYYTELGFTYGMAHPNCITTIADLVESLRFPGFDR